MQTRYPIALCAITALLLSSAPRNGEARPNYRCHKQAKPKNAMIGILADYPVQDGLVTKKFTGFLNRKKVRPNNGCFFPQLQAKRCLVMQYDIAAFKSTKLRGQCVFSQSGKPFRRARPQRRGSVGGDHMLTKCPNRTGYKCDPGHNSKRSRKYEKMLKRKGRMLWSYCPPSSWNNLDKNIGKKVFCQLYDRKTGTVVFATEFTFR